MRALMFTVRTVAVSIALAVAVSGTASADVPCNVELPAAAAQAGSVTGGF